ncbi:8-oxo-dGTP diphosphatase [Natronobacillus azotifigens]|uniref:NUDIX domain-containing protein n=1 Tax=Natronobacillus azotifigens TaxID=472978 RepID=A0A9J6RBQ7_9BACI|nr:NUDIX domain-containing protein [Natronobacillus azotifigens]MCZ0703120.1 NUDIX domain-containing protein [Natronobacillus azotifigens]
MKIKFFNIGKISEKDLSFAVISANYNGKWVYVKHKDRNSWEIPGGHREPGERIDETAKRELYEETGCKKVDLVPICDYSMDDSINEIFGRLFFAIIKEMGQLPLSEVSEVKLFDNLPNNLTYLDVQPKLFKTTLSFIKNCERI